MKKFFIAAAFIMAIMTMTDCKKSQADSGEIAKPENLAADGHFTAEVMHMLGKVSDPQVSPDGSRILFGVTYTSIEQNKGVRQLFVMDIDGGSRTQITHSGKSCSNARWLNDNTVLYLSGGQIYKMPAAGGKAAKVSDVEGGISEFKLSPDCSQLLYVSAVKNHTAPTDVYPDLDKATVRTIDGLMYRHWDHFVEEIPHTFIASLKDGKLGEGKDILDGQPYELPTEPFGGEGPLGGVIREPVCLVLLFLCEKKFLQNICICDTVVVAILYVPSKPPAGWPDEYRIPLSSSWFNSGTQASTGHMLDSVLQNPCPVALLSG